jgi:pimeloyl-ACP methyl ester carboxylesterase
MPRTREQREKAHEGLAQWIGGLKRKSVAELVAHVAENDPRWPEEDRLPWAESKHAMSQAAVDGFALAERRDVTARYPAIPCPVLFLKADADEEQRRKHCEVVSRLPHGEVIHVAGAGHNVRRDEAARTAYHLGRFLSRSS